MTAPDLLPCPFCGNADVYFRMIMGEADVFCRDCETNGPVKETKAEAIAAWNTRATPAAMTPEITALVDRWDDYVESMGSVMGEVEHMAQQMRDALAALRGIGGEG